MVSGLLYATNIRGDIPEVGDTDMLAGHVIDGGVLSTTSKGKEQLFALPALSIAVHDTLVVV